jgi:hypothetical protein
MPASRIPAVSREVATGRRMNVREGFMRLQNRILVPSDPRQIAIHRDTVFARVLAIRKSGTWRPLRAGGEVAVTAG